jgi:ubiquinone/menaquinone biosynthesis C-methylase UbiE
MRVLDVGCGHGDVTLLAADCVGPSGEVVGLDNAEAAVEATRARFAAMANIEIIHADLAEAPSSGRLT